MTEKLQLRITGMDCADCALKLEKGVANLDGVAQCQVDFITAKMRMSHIYQPVMLMTLRRGGRADAEALLDFGHPNGPSEHSTREVCLGSQIQSYLRAPIAAILDDPPPPRASSLDHGQEPDEAPERPSSRGGRRQH